MWQVHLNIYKYKIRKIIAIKNEIKNGGHINIADPEDKSQSYFTVKKNDNSDELVSISYISLPKMYAALSDSGLSSCSDSMRIDDLVQLMLKNDFIFRYYSINA